LQRGGDVGIGELADILGGNGVDNALRVALDVEVALQRATQARDDDLLDDACIVRLSRSRLFGGRRGDRGGGDHGRLGSVLGRAGRAGRTRQRQRQKARGPDQNGL
jgi:hypothetical protein